MNRTTHLLLPLLTGLLFLTADPATAIQRELFKEVRARYEGTVQRLRVDLRPATVATTPNVASAEGIGYARERSPVLFKRLQQVYIGRVTNDGKRRVGLTVYRSAEDEIRSRALAIPAPALANPNAAGTLAAFAQLDSTAVLLETKAGKKQPDLQRGEIEALLDRLFYLSSEPTREELVEAVLRHRGASISQLRALTGLESGDIRNILDEATP